MNEGSPGSTFTFDAIHQRLDKQETEAQMWMAGMSAPEGGSVSNHEGSHLLNDVIALLRREGVFDRLGKAHSQRIVSEMVSRAYEEHDCRHAEILEGHGAALGLCCDCMKPSKRIRADLCPKCRKENGYTEEDVRVDERSMRRSAWFDPEKPLDDFV